MFEKITELMALNRELHIEVNKTIDNIRANYPNIYKRQKGIRVPYTYTKYDTKYLSFDYDAGQFCIKFGDNKGVGFSPSKYKKTWAFNKEDFE